MLELQQKEQERISTIHHTMPEELKAGDFPGLPGQEERKMDPKRAETIRLDLRWLMRQNLISDNFSAEKVEETYKLCNEDKKATMDKLAKIVKVSATGIGG